MLSLLISAALATGLSNSAFAASIQSQTQVSAYDINDNWLSDICFNYSGGAAQTQCQGTYGFTGTNNPGSDLNYSAMASADYGVLKASGFSAISNPGTSISPDTLEPEYITTAGSSSFRDQWTITGGPTGTTGTLQISFAVTGAFDNSMVDSGLTYGLSLYNFTNSTYSSFNVLTGTNFSSGPINTIGILTTQFIFGTPVDFTVNLSAGSTLWNLSQGGYDGLTSFMDLSHTAVMDAIVVQDSEGGVIPFTLATDSNAMLFSELAPAAVPVPAALPLLLSGLLSLTAAGHRRRPSA